MILRDSKFNDLGVEPSIARNLSGKLKYYLRKGNFSDDQLQIGLGGSILAFCPVGGELDSFGEWVWDLYGQLDYMGDYSCDPEKYETRIKDAISELNQYIYNDISHFKYKNNKTALEDIIRNIEWVINKDFSKKENRFFCSGQLWGFLTEVDKEQYQDFYNFLQEQAEELDKQPLSQSHPNYKNEIADYEEQIRYVLGYLKLYS